MGKDTEAVRVGDRIILRERKGKKKLKGSKSTRGQKEPKKAKKLESKRNKNDLISTPSTDFYAKQREQFEYYNESNAPLDEAFALEGSAIKAKAVESLRDIFVSIELAIDCESMKEFKDLLRGEYDREDHSAYRKLVVGVAEMLLDFESSFRNFMVHNNLADYRYEGGAQKGDLLYGNFMIQEAKDNRRILEEKQRVLSLISAKSGIDNKYRKKLLAIAPTDKVHDFVFLKKNDDFEDYSEEQLESPYKEGYDYRGIGY